MVADEKSTTLPLVLSTSPRGVVLRAGPVALETHRGDGYTSVRIPGTIATGMGATDADALADLGRVLWWWVTRDGPRAERGELSKRLRDEWKVLSALVGRDEGADPSE